MPEEDTLTNLKKLLRYVRGRYSDKSEEETPIIQVSWSFVLCDSNISFCRYVMALCSFFQCGRMVMQEVGTVMQEVGKGITPLERNCDMSLNQTGGEIGIKMWALHTFTFIRRS